MNSSEMISIIIPVFNVESYIEKCLVSVTQQTFSNLEIILVDDGSTDGSIDIAKQFAKDDIRIIIISKPNGGVASARNLGLNRATGDYIGFVDPDDWIDAKMYEKLYVLLLKNKADVASCHLRGCNDRNYVEPIAADVSVEVFDHVKTLEIFLGSAYSFNGLNAVVANKLFRKVLFDGLRFNEAMIKGEDTELSHLIFFKSKRLVYTTERLYFYYRRADGLTRRTYPPSVLEIVDFNMLNLFEKKILLMGNQSCYAKVRKSTINDLLSYNIELFYNNKSPHNKKLLKYFKKHYRRYFRFCFTNFNIRRNVRFTLFYISPSLYAKIIP